MADQIRIDGKRLKRLRWSAGLTQAELSVLAGMNRNTVYLIENGLTSGTPRTALKLAHALDTTVDYLLVGDDDAEPEAQSS